MPTKQMQQIPAIYHRKIGDIIVTAISDGTLERTHEMMNNVPEDEAKKRLATAFRSGFVISVNAFLVRNGDRVMLIETGSGDYLGPTAGKLIGNLERAGVAPSEIDTILLTHMHPDHSAGLTDMATGRARFLNAELVVHENEPKHWFDDAAMAKGSERERKLMFLQAREQTAPYLDRMRTFVDGEVAPGITVVPCHGHTPGHCGFLIESGGQSLLVWGDTVHMPEVQVPRPEVSMTVDTDPAEAQASRRRIFDMAASERLLVTGMHLHFPGFGHIGLEGTDYRFVPEPWLQDL